MAKCSRNKRGWEGIDNDYITLPLKSDSDPIPINTRQNQHSGRVVQTGGERTCPFQMEFPVCLRQQ